MKLDISFDVRLLFLMVEYYKRFFLFVFVCLFLGLVDVGVSIEESLIILKQDSIWYLFISSVYIIQDVK